MIWSHPLSTAVIPYSSRNEYNNLIIHIAGLLSVKKLLYSLPALV